MIEEQIKTIKRSFREDIALLTCLSFMTGLTAAACFHDLRALWIFLLFVPLITVCLISLCGKVRIYKNLKNARNSKIIKSEIFCKKIDFIFINEGGKYYKTGKKLFATKIYDSEEKLYIYVFSDSLSEITYPADLEFASEYSKKITARLKDKKLHIKCYDDTNLIAEIKELPLYEINNWKNGRYF